MTDLFSSSCRRAPAPKLSIIVATWNAARTLERCLNSIIRQSFKDWELLIADGGSTDGTVELIRGNSQHIAWWVSEKDSGIYDAWNKAIPQATGEYVCFLGADDAWIDNDALSQIFTAIEGNHYDLITARGLVLDPASGKQSLFGSPWNYRRIGRRMIVCHPGMLHRRELFLEYGLFDTRYRITGDLDFLLRLPENTTSLHVNLPLVLVDGSGVSRRSVMARLREQRTALKGCDRYGPIRAYLVWLDKLWRYPIARLFNIPH